MLEYEMRAQRAMIFNGAYRHDIALNVRGMRHASFEARTVRSGIIIRMPIPVPTIVAERS
jgi:hypothetical protein